MTFNIHQKLQTLCLACCHLASSIPFHSSGCCLIVYTYPLTIKQKHLYWDKFALSSSMWGFNHSITLYLCIKHLAFIQIFDFMMKLIFIYFHFLFRQKKKGKLCCVRLHICELEKELTKWMKVQILSLESYLIQQQNIHLWCELSVEGIDSLHLKIIFFTTKQKWLKTILCNMAQVSWC